MTETFDPYGDDEPDEPAPAVPDPGAEAPAPPEPDDDGPLAVEPDAADVMEDDLAAETSAPELGEAWHDDPAASDELREWLDAEPPSLDPPPGFDARLAEALAGEAARSGRNPDELVREVLDRLGGR